MKKTRLPPAKPRWGRNGSYSRGRRNSPSRVSLMASEQAADHASLASVGERYDVVLATLGKQTVAAVFLPPFVKGFPAKQFQPMRNSSVVIHAPSKKEGVEPDLHPTALRKARENSTRPTPLSGRGPSTASLCKGSEDPVS